jgi:chemotaxis protein CheX
MVVGSFKNGLCDAGYPCKLTIPTVLRGTECALAPTHLARRFAYTFESSSDRLAVDVVVKASS